jgi:formylglycine-generating enzyme required for sulfatase activity
LALSSSDERDVVENVLLMGRHNGSLVVALMALLTLIMAMLLPVLGREFTSTSQLTPQNSLLSPDMQMLDLQRSSLVRVEGGVFFRGTTPDEVQRALELCSENGNLCDAALAENSYPPHRVRLGTFWMEANEVTYRQYVAFLNTLGAGGHISGCLGQFCALTQAEIATGSIVQSGGKYALANPAFADYPVVDVTWYGAQAYCEALGRRLPTEAEWEYAARGVSGTLYPWGDQWNYDAANVRGSTRNRDGVIIAGPQPVGSFSAGASRDGIRDLAGNVAEWVADWYAPDHYLNDAALTDNDPGPSSGFERVVRGGSWDDPAFYARAVHRSSLPPLETSGSVGFRCVANG